MRFIYTKAFKIFALILLGVFFFVLLNTIGYLDIVRRGVLSLPSPVIIAGKWIVVPIKNTFNTIFTLKHLASDNNELNDKVRNLEIQVTELDKLRLENEVLKKEINFKNASGLNLESCPILISDPGIAETFLIGCGSDSGIKKGQAVIYQGRLVGTILLESNKTSSVVFLSHSSSVIDAKISRSGSLGLVKGAFASGLTLESFSSDADIKKGDLVVTAGVNSLVPPGLLIGEVGDILSKPNDLFKKSTVVFPVNPRDILFTFVVK